MGEIFEMFQAADKLIIAINKERFNVIQNVILFNTSIMKRKKSCQFWHNIVYVFLLYRLPGHWVNILVVFKASRLISIKLL